nr:MarR family transcriptional regulator [Gulosibacter faecalis]
MAQRKPLRVDPIAQAKRNWLDHGWEDAALGMSVVTSVVRAHQLMLGEIEATLKPLKLSFARFELLRLLAFTREGRMPTASVISRLQVHPTSVSSAVDRLATAGFVEREPHPTDGRATMLVITDSGREAVEAATAQLNEHVFVPLGEPADDATELVRILARFRKQAGDYLEPKPHVEPLA